MVRDTAGIIGLLAAAPDEARDSPGTRGAWPLRAIATLALLVGATVGVASLDPINDVVGVQLRGSASLRVLDARITRSGTGWKVWTRSLSGADRYELQLWSRDGGGERSIALAGTDTRLDHADLFGAEARDDELFWAIVAWRDGGVIGRSPPRLLRQSEE